MTAGESTRGRPPGHSGAREREERILEELGKHPQGLTRNTLAAHLKEDPAKVWLALDRLRTAGKVRTCAPVPVVAQVDGRSVKRGRQVIWALGEQCPQ
jgi:hypothetical protein